MENMLCDVSQAMAHLGALVSDGFSSEKESYISVAELNTPLYLMT